MKGFSKREIHRRVSQKDLEIKKVCEVGVYLPEESNIIDFIEEGKNAILVEPDPVSSLILRNFFTDNKIVHHQIAVYKRKGKLTLTKAAASTFAVELDSSPALVNDNYRHNIKNQFEVICDKFSSVDPGDIDLLSIDTEGCEWYVISTMKSSPKVISIETHGKYYSNPFINEIQNWIKNNDYKIWYKDKSDTVYIKSEQLKLSYYEHFSLFFINIYLWIRKNKKLLKHNN